MPNPPEPVPPARTVLLVSEPGVDGVFQYVRALAKWLIEHGWTVHLAYSSVRDCPALHEFVARIAQSGGRTLDLRVGNFPGFADLGALRRLRALAREIRPAVIHAHSSKAGALARTLPMLGIHARYLYTPHAYFQMHGPTNAKKRLFSAVESIFGRVGTTLCTSNSEARYARERIGVPSSRIHIAITGIDCVRFHPASSDEEKREARRRFGLPETGLLLGTVARLSSQKDPLTLYRGLAAAMERDPAFAFAHLGKGELSDSVEAFLATLSPALRSRIFRTPSSDDTPSFYRALDAFVLPSRYEGFALSALEAIGTGLPLILTECPGNDDLRAFPLDGVFWSPVGDAGALTDNIVRWATSNPSCNHRHVAESQLRMDGAWAHTVDCYLAPGGQNAEG